MASLLCRIFLRWLQHFVLLTTITSVAAGFNALLMQWWPASASEIFAFGAVISVGVFLLSTLTRQDKVLVASGELGLLFAWSFQPDLLAIWLGVTLSTLALLAVLLSLPAPPPPPDYKYG